MLAFLSKPGTKNVIIVDWGALSGGDTGLLDLSALLATTMYPIVLLNVPPVGKRVAEFIQFLSLKKGISQSQVWIIGHSLGSHIGIFVVNGLMILNLFIRFCPSNRWLCWFFQQDVVQPNDKPNYWLGPCWAALLLVTFR